jgi:hypothetical protein
MSTGWLSAVMSSVVRTVSPLASSVSVILRV